MLAHRATQRLFVVALVAGSLAMLTTSASAAVPAGFPTQVKLPKALVPVFLVSQEFTVDRAGKHELRARVYELDQTVANGKKIRKHFDRLFSRLGWDGGWQEGSELTSGNFRTDGLRVAIAIHPGDGTEEQRIELSVRVLKERPQKVAGR